MKLLSRLKAVFGAEERRDVVDLLESWDGSHGNRPSEADPSRRGSSRGQPTVRTTEYFTGPRLHSPWPTPGGPKSGLESARLTGEECIATKRPPRNAATLPAAVSTAAAAAAGAEPPPTVLHDSTAPRVLQAGAPPAARTESRQEIRPSSLPQPLAQAGQQLATAGSGPGAPGSPDPPAPPVLRRVSSQPVYGAGLSHDSATTLSLHGSSALDEAAASGSGMTERLRALANAAGSKDSSAHSELSRSSAMSGNSSSSNTGSSAKGALAMAGGKLGRSRRQQSPPPATRWHPAMGPVPAALTVAASSLHESLQPQQSAFQDAAAQLPRADPATTSAILPSPPPPAGAAAATAAGAAALPPEDGLPGGIPIPAGDSPDLPGPAPASATVSLLSLQLRGTSTTNSAAASRETSFRGQKRQPGGLSLALSRESSVRGGSVRGTRENSVRGCTQDGSVGAGTRGDSTRYSGSQHCGGGGFERSFQAAPNGQLTYRGLLVVGPEATEAGQAGGEHVGRGSTDWMGLPAVAEALQLAASGPLAPAAADPFSPSTEQAAADLFALLAAAGEAAAAPQKVGSWAQRVTNFPQKPAEPGAARPLPPGGLDPMLLAAALAALAADPPACGSGGGLDCSAMLVGDSELALQGSAELAPAQHEAACPERAHSSRWAGVRGAGAGAGPLLLTEAEGAGKLACSWDAADGVAAAGPWLSPVAQLGGSAPTLGLSPPAARHGSLASSTSKRSLTQLLPELAADDQEWNRSFQKRWRAVKKRAYLQALGLRALWRVNSLSDRHEPLELLTNDLPQYDNGMRRAWSVTRLAAQREEAARLHHHGRHGASAAQPTTGLRHSLDAQGMHKDPSLSALLLGELAEVC